MIRNSSKITTALHLLVAAVMAAALVIGLYAPDYFSASFAAEDGIVEYATALGLFVASGILAAHALRLFRSGRRLSGALLILYALLFFFAGGEEVSWGQRIFGFGSSEFFIENNRQQEFNLHNLVVEDVHLASTLFGSVLTVVMLLYLVVLPLVYDRWKWSQRFSRALMVPVPHLVHAALILACSVLMLIIDLYRNWEVYEFVFAVVTVSIFLRPRNLADFYPAMARMDDRITPEAPSS